MKKPTGVKKITISLSPQVYRWATEMAVSKGFETNFSAYIADLIRRKKEEHEKNDKPAPFPPFREEVIALEEPKQVITPPPPDPAKPKIKLPGKHKN